MMNKVNDCFLSTKNITENNDHVEKAKSHGDLFLRKDIDGGVISVLKDDEEKFLETTYPVQIEHSYSKNYKFCNEEHISKLEIDPIKTDSTFEYENCEFDFTTAEQLDNHTFWCKKKKNPDGVDHLNQNLKEEVLKIDNYENYQTVIQEKENIEQDPLEIEDKLEEVKKEINEELIIKDEPSDTHDDIFECETCELGFDTKIHLISHTSWCKKNKNSIETADQIQNDCTSSNSDDSINILSHSKKKLKPCVKPYGCDVCNKAFHLKGNLIQHKRIHTGDEPYECDVCKKSFRFPSKLRDHKVIHIDEKPFSCDVCGSSFKWKNQLNSHKLIHTDVKSFPCDVCERSFKCKSYLTSHKLIHTGETPLSCDVSGRSFESKIQLSNHNFIHTSVKPFPCDVCRSSFKCKSQLTIHKLIHTGEKPFSCDVCRKSFRTKSQLNNHKLIHNGDKLFACDVCEKKFSQQSGLRQHELIHTAEKPYKCDFCKRSFKLKNYLIRHKCYLIRHRCT